MCQYLFNTSLNTLIPKTGIVAKQQSDQHERIECVSCLLRFVY